MTPHSAYRRLSVCFILPASCHTHNAMNTMHYTVPRILCATHIVPVATQTMRTVYHVRVVFSIPVHYTHRIPCTVYYTHTHPYTISFYSLTLCTCLLTLSSQT